jgi:hypothetical protein
MYRNVIARKVRYRVAGQLSRSASYTMDVGSFPRVKRPGRCDDHPPEPSAAIKAKVHLYFYSPFWTSWSVLGWPLPIPLRNLTAPLQSLTQQHVYVYITNIRFYIYNLQYEIRDYHSNVAKDSTPLGGWALSIDKYWRDVSKEAVPSKRRQLCTYSRTFHTSTVTSSPASQYVFTVCLVFTLSYTKGSHKKKRVLPTKRNVYIITRYNFAVQFLRQDIPVVFKYSYIKKRRTITNQCIVLVISTTSNNARYERLESIQNDYPTCKTATFRLHTCSNLHAF